MRFEHWEWMVRTGKSAWAARNELGFEPHYEHNPDWCFSRFGMSRTAMSDGRTICVGGEHEDFYDADFCIYNDVVLLRPQGGKPAVDLVSGDVEIFGYPEAIFPPTDFHSATMAADRIFIIGRLGYDGKRDPEFTPVLALDFTTYEIATVKTKGPYPGWVYKHHAAYDAGLHAIDVRSGNIYVPGASKETPNYAAYRLHLDGLRWERLCEREKHSRYTIFEDNFKNSPGVEFTAETFQPKSVPFSPLPPEDRGVCTFLISVNGVRITFEDFSSYIAIHVEGELPREVVDTILHEINQKLSDATATFWTTVEA